MSISFLVAVIITASCLLIEKSFSDPTVLPSQNLLPDEILFEIGRHDSDDPALIPKLRQVFKSFSLSSRRHMYMRNNFSVFRTACRKGDVDMMKRVYDAFSPSLGYSSIMQPAMIEADTFGCFREAAENGGLPALHLLYGLCNSSQRVDSLMAQKEYAVSGFNQAIYHGHTAVAKEIFEHWALDETSKEGTASLQSWLIQDTDYDSLRWAVSSGNPAMIALVFEWGTIEQKVGMIQSSNYGAVIEIVDFGMIGILRLFFDTLNSIDENTSGVSINYINTTTTITNDLALSMIIASENAPFIVACREGHLEISQQIFRWMEGFSNNSTHVENLKQTAISQHNYLAFRKASQRNQLHVVKQLFKWASPTHRRNMIASGDFLGYNWAISSGFTAMAKLHVRHASSTQRDEMLGNQTRRL